MDIDAIKKGINRSNKFLKKLRRIVHAWININNRTYIGFDPIKSPLGFAIEDGILHVKYSYRSYSKANCHIYKIPLNQLNEDYILSKMLVQAKTGIVPILDTMTREEAIEELFGEDQK